MKDKHEHSLYIKQNKRLQALLAVLIISFILLFAVVLSSVSMPVSKTWQNNVLLRMINNTQEFIRGNSP